MYLVIDIGNTYTKFAYFNDDIIEQKNQIENNDIENSGFVNSIKTDDYVIISSVNSKVSAILN